MIVYQIDMTLVCPECKNELEGEAYTNLAHEQIIECDTCGMTLQYLVDGDTIELDVVEEGK